MRNVRIGEKNFKNEIIKFIRFLLDESICTLNLKKKKQ